MLPLDLHVLSLQLAFILSQDQTLHCKSIVSQHKADLCSVQDAVQFIDFINTLRLKHITIYKTSIDGSIFFLYYLYCLSIFQRTCCFRFKSGCKGKRFYFNYQMFRKFFFIFLFISFLRLSQRKGKKVKKKNKTPFLCESDCKDKNFQLYLPNFIGSFFVLIFKQTLAFTLSQFIKAFFSWKAGAKVVPFQIYSKLKSLFF